MQTHIANPIEVPEDVLAELAIAEAEAVPQTPLPSPDAVPEDTRGELDREARMADAELQLQLTEGQPPAQE